VVEKPLIGGDWAGVLSSNDACRLSHSHPKWWPDSPGLVGKIFSISRAPRIDIHVS